MYNRWTSTVSVYYVRMHNAVPPILQLCKLECCWQYSLSRVILCGTSQTSLSSLRPLRSPGQMSFASAVPPLTKTQMCQKPTTPTLQSSRKTCAKRELHGTRVQQHNTQDAQELLQNLITRARVPQYHTVDWRTYGVIGTVLAPVCISYQTGTCNFFGTPFFCSLGACLRANDAWQSAKFVSIKKNAGSHKSHSVLSLRTHTDTCINMCWPPDHEK